MSRMTNKKQKATTEMTQSFQLAPKVQVANFNLNGVRQSKYNMWL